MSTPVFVDEGENDVLNLIKNNASMKCRLFKNSLSPAHGTVLGDLTTCDFSGYADQALSYGTPATNGSNQGQMTASQLTFSHSGGGTANDVYGYAIFNNTSGKLHKVEVFDAPITLAVSGDDIKITDKYLADGTIT